MAQAVSPGDARRGRGADKVGEIPPSGWKDILWRTYGEIVRDHVLLIAAGVTFYALLALVPTLTALVSIYGLFADPATLDRHADLLVGFVPDEGLALIREQLARLAERGSTTLGVTSLVALGTPARPAWVALAGAAAAMMPRWARRLYSLPGLPTTDAAATAAGLAFRTGLLVVPEKLRHGPHLKDAQRRLALA